MKPELNVSGGFTVLYVDVYSEFLWTVVKPNEKQNQ